MRPLGRRGAAALACGIWGLFVITGCEPRTGDTVPLPRPAFDAIVSAGSGHAAGFISAANAGSVDITLDMPSQTVAGVLKVELIDGLDAVVSDEGDAPMSGGSVLFAGLDASSLADGPLTLRVTVTTPFGSASIDVPVTKDTVAPDAPSAAGIPAIASVVPADTINDATAGSVAVSVTVPATAMSTDSVVVRLSDGEAEVASSPVAAPPGGGEVAPAALDASSLLDGDLELSVELVDAAGNRTSFGPVSVTKDTVAPDAPEAARLPAGVGNLEDRITPASQGGVWATVDFGAASSGQDLVVVELDDGAHDPVTLSSTSPGLVDILTVNLDGSATPTVSALASQGFGAFAPAQSFPFGGLTLSPAFHGFEVPEFDFFGAIGFVTDGLDVGLFAAGRFEGTIQVFGGLSDIDGELPSDFVVALVQGMPIFVSVSDIDDSIRFSVFDESEPALVLPDSNPATIAAGDLDGDDAMDLVIGLNGTSTPSLLVLFGDGLLGFTASTTLAIGAGGGFPGPRSLVLADVDGDERLDIVFAKVGRPGVGLITNLGSRTFAAAVEVPMGGEVREVAVVDHDGDEVPDLLAVARDDSAVVVADTVTPSVLARRLGLGGGTFDLLETQAAGDDPRSFSVRDLNSDGRPDIVVADRANDEVILFFNPGDGGFGTAQPLAVGARPVTVEAVQLAAPVDQGPNAPSGAATFSYGAGNASGLQDGPVTLRITITDPALNRTVLTQTVTKTSSN